MLSFICNLYIQKTYFKENYLVYKISNVVKTINISPTLSLTSIANDLKKQGKDIIVLSSGELEKDTPDYIKENAIAAIRNGYTKYTPVDGIIELKEAIINKLEKENNLLYKKNEVIVSSGAKQSIFNLMKSILNPDDEVIIISPYWVSYPEISKLNKAKVIIVNTKFENNFKLKPTELEKKISNKTKIIIFNSPANPTGIVYSKKELQEIAKVIIKYPYIVLLSDDVYENIIWGKKFMNMPMAEPKIRKQTVIVSSLSKSFSMTGWRIGYAAGPPNIISAMKIVQSQSTSNPSSISQWAALSALESKNTKFIKDNAKELKIKNCYMTEELNNIEGIKCLKSNSTFYLFPNIKGLLEKFDDIEDDIQFCNYILKTSGVSLVPGSFFGAPGYIRISFVKDLNVLKEGLKRIKNTIQKKIKI
jgi:aspartate aminotransferase